MNANDEPVLKDVIAALRNLARSYYTVADAVVQVAESQLAMTIDISERLRDAVVSHETLEEARKAPLPAKFRQDSKRVVDLIADVGAVAHLIAIRLVEGYGKGDH
jgi:hypothetical protein